MSDDLQAAFAVLERRGQTAGADAVIARALADIADTPPPTHRRSRWLAGVGIAVAAAVLAGVLYVRSEAGHFRRVDVAAALGDRDASSYGPMNVLIVGTDGERADLIMVAHLDPAHRRAAIVSIPRDLWVHNPSTNQDDRLANVLGRGPVALIDAVRARLAIEVDHFVQVDVGGFRDLVSIVGGVRVPFAVPERDVVSGLIVPAGCVKLDGDQALAFVRSRHVETLEDGRWRSDPTGDLGRIQRQQLVVRQLVVGVGAVGGGDPLRADRLVDALAAHAVVDSGFSTSTLLRLARDFHAVPADAIAMLTLPTTVASIDGAVVLQLDEAAASPVVAALSDASTAPSSRAASAAASAPC